MKPLFIRSDFYGDGLAAEAAAQTPGATLPARPRPMLAGGARLLLTLALVGPMAALVPGFINPAPAQAQPVSPEVGLGYQRLSQGQVEAAIAQFQRVLRRDPTDQEALLGLGIAYRRAGRDDAALQAYQRVLELDPDNRLALTTLGLLGEYQPEWQPIGIAALTRLLQLEPDNLEARAQRAKLYFYQGQFSPALADYARVLPDTTDLAVLGPAAEAYTYSGDSETGFELFERYRAAGGIIGGDRAIAYAQALRDRGQVEAAIQLLDQQLRQAPDSVTQQIRLRGALASTYATNRQFQPALELIQPLRGRADSRLTLARSLTAIGDYSQQIAYLQEAAALYQQVLATVDAPTPGILREASMVFSRLPGQRPAALQLTQQLAQQPPQDASLILQAQILSYQIGQLSAVDLVNQVRASFPQLPSDPVQVRQMAQSLGRLDPPLAQLLPLYQSLGAAAGTEPFLQFRMAQILAQQGQLAAAQQALATYAATPAGRLDTDTVQLLAAELDRRQGNLAQSAQRYQGLLSTTPLPQVRASALQGLATVYQTQGQTQMALQLYDQLIAENPQSLDYSLGRTALAYQAGLVSAAAAGQQLQQAVSQYPQGVSAAALAGLATVLPPDPQRASLYQQLLAVDPANAGLQLRSLQLLATTDAAAAVAQAQQLVAQNPTNLDLYFVLGEIAQQVGDYTLAQSSYAAVLSQQPNNLDALLAQAGLAFQRGDYARANELYRQALAQDQQNPVARTSLAALNAVQGRPLVALQQLQDWQQSQGIANAQVAEQAQRIQEGLLQQRGIQPGWERF